MDRRRRIMPQPSRLYPERACAVPVSGTTHDIYVLIAMAKLSQSYPRSHDLVSKKDNAITLRRAGRLHHIGVGQRKSPESS